MSKAILEMAIAEINAHLEATQSPGRVRLRVEDTRLEAARVANAYKALIGAGARLIIGPQSSDEVRGLLPLLNDAGVIAISTGSTDGSITQQRDFLIRFVTDDRTQGDALGAAAASFGAHTVIPVWRSDSGNRGIARSARRAFTASGIKVTAGIEYPTEKPDFAGVVRQIVSQLPAGWTEGGVIVQLSSYEECVEVFRAASAVPELAQLRWLGSDGGAQIAPLLTDRTAGEFALATHYMAPAQKRPTASRAKWEPLAKAVSASTGMEPDLYVLAAYDACWCAVLAGMANGGTYGPMLRTFLYRQAEFFHGATGWGRLNANGDRALGDFEFWGLAKTGDALKWTSLATYEGGVYRRNGLGGAAA